jgi:hypothetical protein
MTFEKIVGLYGGFFSAFAAAEPSDLAIRFGFRLLDYKQAAERLSNEVIFLDCATRF